MHVAKLGLWLTNSIIHCARVAFYRMRIVLVHVPTQ